MRTRSGQRGKLKKSQSEFGFLFIFLFAFSAPYPVAENFQGETVLEPRPETRQACLQQQHQEEEQQEVKVPEQKIRLTHEDSPSLRMPDFGPDGLKDLSPEQIKKLQAGEVVMTSSPEVTPDGHSVIAAAVMFKVPVERAWEILSATDRQIEYLEEIKKLRVVEAGEDFNRTEFEVKVMGQKVRYTVVHHFLPELYYLWWELDKKAPHDLKDLSGFWRLYPAGEGKTIGRYGSRVVPGFPVPEF
ncbi:MAG TPA: SRPBCC family protein, partial [Candidatus Saccharicenans sp.]|nr:SRPBCC family protein [Candidatus Saccharicenans sp.]